MNGQTILLELIIFLTILLIGSPIVRITPESIRWLIELIIFAIAASIAFRIAIYIVFGGIKIGVRAR